MITSVIRNMGKKPALISVCIFMLFIKTSFLLLPGLFLSNTAAREKTPDYLRFHVLAHSNKPADQELKNSLALYLLQELAPHMNNISTRSEMKLLLADKQFTCNLERAARQFLHAKGYYHTVTVSSQRKPFPARFYRGRFLPPGEYLALQVIIGSGKGENWWCLLFPPLCFTPVMAEEEDQEEEKAFFSVPPANEGTGEKEKDFPPPPRFFIMEMVDRFYSYIMKKISN